MAKKPITSTLPLDPSATPEARQNVVSREITTEMRESFIDYAMSVITERALPDVRDGLKPVARRILFAMNDMGLTSGAKSRKSAAVVGEVLGNYHPHGDVSVYEAMVVMAQDFKMRYPLVLGQGNFGCFTIDTKVELVDGRALTFGELIEEDKLGKKNYTYTVNAKGLVEVAEIVKPRLTRKNAELIKITLDNGEEIRCTLNHKFMMRDGTYTEAEFLKSGDSLMPLYKRLSISADSKYFQNKEIVDVVKEVLYNHKVTGVKLLDDKEDVYDLTINGTHNFALAAGIFVHNSIDGDSAAAMRYTEAKMTKLSAELLRDIEKETVNYVPNYDGTRKEPKVLPTAVPNLLLNGTLGIAVGMATNIAPHNLHEIVDAVSYLIDNTNATTEDLLQFVKGPDFPTGGVAFNAKDIAHAYATGRGGVVVRGVAEIVENKAGQFQIVVTSIPYRVNKSDLLIKIADLWREKKIEGLKAVRDESAKDIRIVIELKGGGHPQNILNKLYKHTQLEETFHFNMVALVDGVPETLSLKGILEQFVLHRVEVIRRRTEFDLRKALEREHILLGLKKALDHIDEIIKLIRASKDVPTAHAGLMKQFKFSTIQTSAILAMRLATLAGLERKKIEEELRQIQELIEKLKAILGSPKKILSIIKDELKEIKEKYGDARRTKIVKGGVQVLSVEDLIPDEENALVLTSGGYIKRTHPDEFRKQKRGGVGVVDLDTKEEDFVTNLLVASTHADLLFFTNKGKAYQTKMYDIPEGRRATKGKSVMNFLPLIEGESITSILPMPKEVKNSNVSLMMMTKQGVIKKCSAASFHDVRISGIIAIKLDAGDELISASFTDKGDSMMAVSAKGQSIHFKEADIREMGRTAMGVRGMKLGKGDVLIAAEVVSKKSGGATHKPTLMVISEHGYGKRTNIDEYKLQNRGGSGIKTANVTTKTGQLISAKVFVDDDAEVVAISKKSQVIRVDAQEIPVLGRQTQGVRVMKLREGDSIASLICL